MEIVRDGSCPVGNVRVGVLSSGSCAGGSCSVGVVRWELSRRSFSVRVIRVGFVRLRAIRVGVVWLSWWTQIEIFIYKKYTSKSVHAISVNWQISTRILKKIVCVMSVEKDSLRYICWRYIWRCVNLPGLQWLVWIIHTLMIFTYEWFDGVQCAYNIGD